MSSSEKLQSELADEDVFWKEYKRREASLNDQWFSSFSHLYKSLMVEQSKDCLNYCVSSVKCYSIRILSINIVFLVAFILLIATTGFEAIGDVNSPKYTVIIQQVNIWLFFSVFGLGYFLLLTYSPKSFKEYFEVSPYDMWIGYCRTINVSYLLIYCVKLFRYGPLFHDTCYELIDLNVKQDNSFTFLFLEMFVDTIQTVVFTTLPLPWAYSMFLCFIKLVSHLSLMTTCFRSMKHSNEKWFIEIAILSFFNIFLILAASCNTMTRSTQSSYTIESELNKKYAQHKHRLVHFLSNGVKYPLQCVLLSLDNVIDSLDLEGNHSETSAKGGIAASPKGSGKSPTGSERHSTFREIIQSKEDVIGVAVRASSLCDDLLLLLRLQEEGCQHNRALTPCNVRDLFQSVLDASPHQDALPYLHTISPYSSVTVDKELLTVIMRHFLLFATRHINARLSSPLNANAAILLLNGGASLRITLEEKSLFNTKDSKKDRKYLLRMLVQLDKSNKIGIGGASVVAADAKSVEHVRRSVVICYELVKHLKGSSLTVNEAELDHFELTVECEQYSADYSVNSNSYDAAREVKYEVGLVLLDSVVEGVVRNTLQDCADVAVPKTYLNINELINSALRINGFQVVFLDSIVDCKLLKELGFQGLIVFVSSSKAYLASCSSDLSTAPESVRRYCDYILPLPCFLLDSKELILWLESTATAEVLRKRQNEGIAAPAAVLEGAASFRRLGWEAGRRGGILSTSVAASTGAGGVRGALMLMLSYFFGAVVWFFVRTEFAAIRIPSSQYEKYSKWRLLNPTKYLFHHTNLVSIRLLVYMAHSVVHIYLRGGSLAFGGFNAVLIVTLLVLFRRYAYNFMIRHFKKVFSGFNLYYFWSLLSTLYVAVNFIAFVVFLTQGRCTTQDCASIFKVSGGSDLVGSTVGGVFSGRSLIDFVTNGGGIFVGWLFHFTWPFRLIYIVISAIRVLFIVCFIAREAVTDLVFCIVVLFYVLLIIVAIGVETHCENLYRREYMALRRHLVRQHLCDWCEGVARRELRQDLREVSEAKNKFLLHFTQKVASRVIVLNEDLLRFLGPMHFSDLKLTEMTHLLRYAPSTRDLVTIADAAALSASGVTNSGNQVIGQPVAVKSVVVLSTFVTRQLFKFKGTLDALGIRLFLDIDPSLTVVRISSSLFAPLLSGAVSRAIANILRSQREHQLRYTRESSQTEKSQQLYRTSSNDTQQEILVIIKPLRPALDDKSVPQVPKFMDTRMMIVNVLDTSSSAARRTTTKRLRKEKYSEGVGRGLEDRQMYRAAAVATEEQREEEEDAQLEALEGWSSYYSCEHISVDMCTSLIEDCGRRSSSTSYFVEMDALEHAHYGAYYRFTMPYKLNKDSKKAAEYRGASDSGPEGGGGWGKRVLDGCALQEVSREVRPLLEAYHQHIVLNPRHQSSRESSVNEKSESRKNNPAKARRNILLYVNRNPDSVREYSRYSSLFELRGWKCSTSTDLMLRDTGAVELGSEPLDAILIDHRVGDQLFNVILAARIRFGPSLVVSVLYDCDEDIARSKVFLTEITVVDVNLVKPISPEYLVEKCNQFVISQLLLLY